MPIAVVDDLHVAPVQPDDGPRLLLAAVIPLDSLPAKPYVARGIVTTSGEPRETLVERPFVLAVR